MQQIEQLIHLLARLPGLGPRSARRAVLHMLQQREHYMVPLSQAINDTAKIVKNCKICGNLDSEDPCHICNNNGRDQNLICVVEQVSDVWALERMGQYKGLYHVLGGVLSPIEGVRPEDLRIAELQQRCTQANQQQPLEIIIATNLTVDGQTTAHYISQQIKLCDNNDHITITRIAHGVPVGGELDYWDEGTLFAAINARRALI